MYTSVQDEIIQPNKAVTVCKNSIASIIYIADMPPIAKLVQYDISYVSDNVLLLTPTQVGHTHVCIFKLNCF